MRKSVIVAVLDIVPRMHACGAAWLWWQFPAPRNVGELGTLMKTLAPPCEPYGGSDGRIEAELLASFGETLQANE